MASCDSVKTLEPDARRATANGVEEPLRAYAVDGATLGILPRPMRVRV